MRPMTRRCSATNKHDPLGRKDIQCGRPGTHLNNGKPYCWQHVKDKPGSVSYIADEEGEHYA